MHDFCRSLLVSLALWQSASAFHKYSSAWENTPSEIPFTGVNEVRNDVSISGIPNDGCSTPITGTPVYQPEWVVQTSNSDTWTELGTGHQCGDTFRYWYWLEGAPGLPNGYLLRGWRLAGGDVPHRFYLYRLTDCTWLANIDYTQVGSFGFCSSGVRVGADTESYAQAAVVPSHRESYLQYSSNYAPYANWSGQDYSLPPVAPSTPEMCGFWVNATSWSTGENTICN